MKTQSFKEFLNESNFTDALTNKYSNDIDKLNISDKTYISINLIKVKEKSNGIGTKIMNEIIEYADKEKKLIVLSPSKDFGGTVSRLIKFYKRFDFVENKGKNKDYEISETMYRIHK